MILVVATDAVKDSPTSVRVDVTASARVRSSMLVAACNRCVIRAGIRVVAESLTRGNASIQIEHLASDERRRGCQEEQDGACHVIDFRNAPERNPR